MAQSPVTAADPWFAGGGRRLIVAVLGTIGALLLVLAALLLLIAGDAWRWWRAPVPTTLPFDPATAPRPSRPVAPIGSQAAWFPAYSYPAAARRAGEQGRVSVKLLVESDGNASACEVVAGSGSATLDAATCRLAVRNGRFAPALGRDGEPVRGVFTMRNVVWQLED